MIRTEVLGKSQLMERSEYALNQRLNELKRTCAEINARLRADAIYAGDPNCYCVLSLEHDSYPGFDIIEMCFSIYVTVKITWDDENPNSRIERDNVKEWFGF